MLVLSFTIMHLADTLSKATYSTFRLCIFLSVWCNINIVQYCNINENINECHSLVIRLSSKCLMQIIGHVSRLVEIAQGNLFESFLIGSVLRCKYYNSKLFSEKIKN